MARRADLPFKPWTPEADALALRMADDGFTAAEIGARILRSPSAVQQRLSGLRRGVVGAKSGKPEPIEVCRQAWTEDEIATVRRRRADGASHAAIGAELGRSKGSVVSKVLGLGLSAPVVATPALPAQAAPPEPAVAAIVGEPAPSDPAEALLPRRPRRVRECIWTSGERPHYVFCSEPAEPGRPWCAEHCARGFVRGSSLDDRRREHA